MSRAPRNAAALMLSWLVASCAEKPPATVEPSVQTATARLGIFALRVDAQGRVGAPAGSSSQLSFAVPGIVRSIDVHVGDRVVAGQPVAELDDATYALSVAQAQADAAAASAAYGGGSVPSAAVSSAAAKERLARAYVDRLEGGGPAAAAARSSAVAGVRQADLKVDADQRSLAREQALYAAGIAAAKDVEAARSQLAADTADAQALHAKSGGSTGAGVVAQAQADLAQAEADTRAAAAQSGSLAGQAAHAQAALDLAESDLGKTVLRAPADGVVLRILRHAGESADLSTPVVEVGPPSPAAATAFVSASDARAIRAGDAADIRLMRSSASAHAHVTAVVPAVDPVTQESTVVLDGLPPGAVAGDAIRASITIADHRGILIPATAVVQDPQTGNTLVFVRKRDGTGFDARQVVVDASDDRTAEISSGLSAGDVVAAQGAYELLAPAQ